MAPIMEDVMDADPTPLLTLTGAARAKVLEVRTGEPEPETLALWIEVSGVQGGAYKYDMYFRPLAEVAGDDVVLHGDDLTVVVGAGSADKLQGATLDLTENGMVMSNPNTPSPAPGPSPAVGREGPPPDLSGDVAQRVLQVLEQQINPAIAGHGGMAELVAVEESVAYLRLAGGCQGCGMASVTLTQGIEVAIRDAIPEITAVRDVTDHAAGENPYYEAAKK